MRWTWTPSSTISKRPNPDSAVVVVWTGHTQIEMLDIIVFSVVLGIDYMYLYLTCFEQREIQNRRVNFEISLHYTKKLIIETITAIVDFYVPSSHISKFTRLF